MSSTPHFCIFFSVNALMHSKYQVFGTRVGDLDTSTDSLCRTAASLARDVGREEVGCRVVGCGMWDGGR